MPFNVHLLKVVAVLRAVPVGLHRERHVRRAEEREDGRPDLALSQTVEAA